jgi:hypothetical protein
MMLAPWLTQYAIYCQLLRLFWVKKILPRHKGHYDI